MTRGPLGLTAGSRPPTARPGRERGTESMKIEHDDLITSADVWLALAGIPASLAVGCAFGAAWGWLAICCMCLMNAAVCIAKAVRDD